MVVVGMVKGQALKKWSMVTPEKEAPVTLTTLGTTGPCASRLSAVNAIGTQLRDLIKLGTDPMVNGGLNKEMDAVAETERNPVSKHQIDDSA